ncbi:hypothetical protein GGR57DRAFT_409691 [Xylariaceae sp. FL1272]|nr:hypothetical protein GGR57DRAFT_409691 [Xylariaceae sp. FL1272]
MDGDTNFHVPPQGGQSQGNNYFQNNQWVNPHTPQQPLSRLGYSHDRMAQLPFSDFNNNIINTHNGPAGMPILANSGMDPHYHPTSQPVFPTYGAVDNSCLSFNAMTPTSTPSYGSTFTTPNIGSSSSMAQQNGPRFHPMPPHLRDVSGLSPTPATQNFGEGRPLSSHTYRAAANRTISLDEYNRHPQAQPMRSRPGQDHSSGSHQPGSTENHAQLTGSNPSQGHNNHTGVHQHRAQSMTNSYHANHDHSVQAQRIHGQHHQTQRQTNQMGSARVPSYGPPSSGARVVNPQAVAKTQPIQHIGQHVPRQSPLVAPALAMNYPDATLRGNSHTPADHSGIELLQLRTPQNTPSPGHVDAKPGPTIGVNKPPIVTPKPPHTTHAVQPSGEKTGNGKRKTPPSDTRSGGKKPRTSPKGNAAQTPAPALPFSTTTNSPVAPSSTIHSPPIVQHSKPEKNQPQLTKESELYPLALYVAEQKAAEKVKEAQRLREQQALEAKRCRLEDERRWPGDPAFWPAGVLPDLKHPGCPWRRESIHVGTVRNGVKHVRAIPANNEAGVEFHIVAMGATEEECKRGPPIAFKDIKLSYMFDQMKEDIVIRWVDHLLSTIPGHNDCVASWKEI